MALLAFSRRSASLNGLIHLGIRPTQQTIILHDVHTTLTSTQKASGALAALLSNCHGILARRNIGKFSELWQWMQTFDSLPRRSSRTGANTQYIQLFATISCRPCRCQSSRLLAQTQISFACPSAFHPTWPSRVACWREASAKCMYEARGSQIGVPPP